MLSLCTHLRFHLNALQPVSFDLALFAYSLVASLGTSSLLSKLSHPLAFEAFFDERCHTQFLPLTQSSVRPERASRSAGPLARSNSRNKHAFIILKRTLTTGLDMLNKRCCADRKVMQSTRV